MSRSELILLITLLERLPQTIATETVIVEVRQRVNLLDDIALLQQSE